MSIRLKLLRKKLGVTLELLAEKSGMTKSYLSKVERGLNTPSIAAALKLARALNVNVEELFAGEAEGQARYSLVRQGERQALVGSGEGPGYSVLTSQVGQRSLLPFLIQPPTEFQPAERRGEGGCQVADGVQRHQQQQHVLAQQLGAKNRQRRRADHHPQCIGTDGMAHLGFGQVQVAGNIGHQAHDGELAGADGEAAKGHGGFHFHDGGFGGELRGRLGERHLYPCETC